MSAANGLQLLLVEDDPIHARIIRHVVQRSGCLAGLIHVKDGESAIRLLLHQDEQASTLPHLVVLDIQLPRVDGFGVLTRIRACHYCQHIPVVIVSTSNQPDDIDRGYRAGANAYLCKSPDFDVFAERLTHMCRFWQAVELPYRPVGPYRPRRGDDGGPR